MGHNQIDLNAKYNCDGTLLSNTSEMSNIANDDDMKYIVEFSSG